MKNENRPVINLKLNKMPKLLNQTISQPLYQLEINL